MLKKIGIALVVIVVAILGFAATKPDTFRVQRSATVKAPPEKIFPLIDDFRRWTAWSPWEKVDPAMKRSYDGAPSGKGAAYAWDGNGDVGAGRMEIVESTPSSRIAIKLDFVRPLEGHNVAEFTLQPVADGTTVTWAMYGPAPFLSKLMQVFFSMDAMIGGAFETGLADLKTIAEK